MSPPIPAPGKKPEAAKTQSSMVKPKAYEPDIAPPNSVIANRLTDGGLDPAALQMPRSPDAPISNYSVLGSLDQGRLGTDVSPKRVLARAVYRIDDAFRPGASHWITLPEAEGMPLPDTFELTGMPRGRTATRVDPIGMTPPPLLEAKPRKRKRPRSTRPTESEFLDGETISVPSPRVGWKEELDRVEREIRRLRPEMKKTERKAKSSLLGALPKGGVFAAIYDYFVREDNLGAAQNLAEEGLETSVERIGEGLGKELPSGWMAPYDAYQVHTDMRAHGANAERMESLKMQRYRLMDRLGSPDARYDLPGVDFYLGPKDLMYDSRTDKPVKRFQD